MNLSDPARIQRVYFTSLGISAVGFTIDRLG